MILQWNIITLLHQYHDTDVRRGTWARLDHLRELAEHIAVALARVPVPCTPPPHPPTPSPLTQTATITGMRAARVVGGVTTPPPPRTQTVTTMGTCARRAWWGA